MGFEDGWYCVWCGEKVGRSGTDEESHEDAESSVSNNSKVHDSASEVGEEGQDDPRYCQACECALVYPGEVSFYDSAARAEMLLSEAVDGNPRTDLGHGDTDNVDAAGCDGELSFMADEEDPALIELGEWARSVRDQVLTMKFQRLSASSGSGSHRLLRHRTSSSGVSVSGALSRPSTAASASSGTEEHIGDMAPADIEGTANSDTAGVIDEPEAEWTEQELQEYWDWYYGTGSHDTAADAEYEEYNANYDFDLVDNNDYSSYAQWFAEDAGSATDGAGEVIFVGANCVGCMAAVVPPRPRLLFGVVLLQHHEDEAGTPVATNLNSSFASTGSTEHNVDYGYYDNHNGYYVRYLPIFGTSDVSFYGYVSACASEHSALCSCGGHFETGRRW